MNNTMPDIQWFRFFRGQLIGPQFFAYRNGICAGQKSADFFGDYAEMFYPSSDQFSKTSEGRFLWAQLMDITYNLLWGHSQAPSGIAGSYTLSDWYTSLDGTPGFGFLTNCNPGNQTIYATRLRFTSAERTTCMIV
jgi:hypothetical protein